MASPAAVVYGPIFLGMVINIMLYGIMITQIYLYHKVYKQDPIWIRCLVIVIFLCDTLNSIFDLLAVYLPLVNNFGDLSALINAPWVAAMDPVMTATIAILVQLFYAWRVKALTRNIPAFLFICFCAICSWCGGAGSTIALRMLPAYAQLQRFEVIVIIWLAFAALADIAIATILVLYLSRRRTGFAQTDHVINRIIRLTVQTGLITTVFTITDLILFVTFPTGLHLIFNLALSKLYSNSLMSSLNSRAAWQPEDNISERRQSLQVPNLLRRPESAQLDGRIFVDVESHQLRDFSLPRSLQISNAGSSVKSCGSPKSYTPSPSATFGNV
ncbi:hypothetical protein CERSUDRAFT_112279 [Gelatoporia subvermispora B]|uniref:DUF6534 domain-containing protein n=1 Tax=Ceriporiopsis subvermispora (strain B) TaxID=914234 RepID=M2PTM2_CERS8|nr:hypothetical protein CERSUDRAFT_112279 [Gelatoporia subvermispora B]